MEPKKQKTENEEHEGVDGKFVQLQDEKPDNIQVQGQGISKKDLAYLKSDKSWEQCRISYELTKNLIHQGYKKPSQIQGQSILILMMRKNSSLLAQSQNGSGKTLAFVIPLIEKIDLNKKVLYDSKFYPQSIILCHTKELCYQVEKIIINVSKGYKQIKTSILIGSKGGYSSNVLKPGHVIIGTPGRIKNIIRQTRRYKPNLDVSQVMFFVADEADQLMDQAEEQNYKCIMEIINKINERAQICFFSATYPQQIREGIEKEIDKRKLTKKFIIKKKEEKLKLDGILQVKYQTDQKKDYVITQVLRTIQDGVNCVIIFVNTRKFAQRINQHLMNQKIRTGFIIGKMTEKERQDIIEMFNNGKLNILITTDLLARGYDNREVGLVINLDIPKRPNSIEPQYETYLHRIGRCGRFGDRGVALNIIDDPNDDERLEKIRKHYDMKIEQITDLKDLKIKIKEQAEKTKKVRTEIDDDF